MKYFMDTSSLVKIYHKETGTQLALKIYKDDNEILISELGKLEFTSTIHRKFRENVIDGNTVRILLTKFQEDVDNRYKVLRFSTIVVNEAINLLRKYAKNLSLRTLDSLQLAFFSIYRESDVIFVCSDLVLAKIAEREGYEVFIP